MASIATSIQIIDRVSAPINNMIVALDNMCSAYESVQDSMNTGFNTRTIDQARQAIDAAAQQVTQLGNNIEDNEEHQQNFNRTVQNGSSAMDGLLGKVISLVAAYATFEKVTDMSDELVSTRARLDQMNDGLQSTDELVNMVYASAQNARGSFTDMAAVVAKFGNNAKDAFSSSEEVVAFANLIQKQMTIAGASTQEASNAMLQLSQALGSGVLRGDELNSIFEQAPNLIQSIADYLDVPIGKIREMAQDGQLTADVVKAAIFASADDINAKFEQMPMTWGQVWTTMGNAALMQMQPVLTKVNEIANNEDFQLFAANAVSAFATVVEWLLNILELASSIAAFISDNWSIIEPIVLGIATALGLYTAALIANNVVQGISAAMAGVKAAADMMQAGATFTATAAQYGLNAALMACPLTWIILLIIVLIAIIYAVCAAIAKMTGVANSGFGVICGGVNVVIQFFKNLGLTVANIALGIGNAIAALGSNMMTAFHNAICSIQSWFYNLLSTALTVVAGICEALNKLPFVEFDYSGITSAADDYAAKASEAAGNKEDYKSIGDAFNDGMSTFDTFQDGWASDAFNAGAAWGDGVADKVSNMFSGSDGGVDTSNMFSGSDGGVDTSNMFNGGGYSGYDAGQVPANIADTAANTGKAADSLDITSEDLKYLRDIAETEAINRFTTAEIKVEMTNNNNVSGDMDLDGMVDYLANGVNEAMEKAAEGVHD
jgi:tape measure domain-containing protein